MFSSLWKRENLSEDGSGIQQLNPQLWADIYINEVAPYPNREAVQELYAPTDLLPIKNPDTR